MRPAALVHALMAAAALGLAACAPMQPDAGPASPARPAEAEAAPAGFVAPERANYTPFGMVLVTASDRDGEYFSLSTKIAFDFDAQGRLTLATRQEALIDENDDPALDHECTDKGGGMNQRTAWFPDTALFVREGALQSVRLASGKTAGLVPLARDERGFMMVMGPRARQTEYAFVPCVGGHRVAHGDRLNGFLPREATLIIRPASGGRLQLALPRDLEPFLLLRYREGAMIPVPLRPVLASVDMAERRLVVQYQSTFPLAPPIRKIELRAIKPDGRPGPDETAERYRERTEATLRDLRQCPPPVKPMEPCASPRRAVDRRIFSP